MINIIIIGILTGFTLFHILTCSDNDSKIMEERYKARGEKSIHRSQHEQIDEIIYELKGIKEKLSYKNE